jgi:excisionase family DNA binding protein
MHLYPAMEALGLAAERAERERLGLPDERAHASHRGVDVSQSNWKEVSHYHSRLVSPAQAAVYAGVHTDTIRRYISQGLLTGYRLGNKLIRIDLDELDAMLRPVPTAGTVNAQPQSTTTTCK